MTAEEKQDDYLAKAKEADALAEKARNAIMRDTWRKIANNYRNLAMIAGRETKS